MNDKKYYVYCWTNNVNGKMYVGKGCNDRFNAHVQESTREKPGSLIAKAMKKYGIENFSLDFLTKGVDEETAFNWETVWISLLDTNTSHGGHGYNRNDGGEGPSSAGHSSINFA